MAVAPSNRATVATLVLATVATVYPGFLIGALSVQVSAEFAVSPARYGWGVGGFFLAATASSIVMGRVVQIVGPRRQILGAITLSIVAQIGVTQAGSFWAIVGCLGLAGAVNSANQSAINLALAEAQLPRLGLAVALKQSGMPSASMLSGAAVPALALTVGWRGGFVAGVLLCVVAFIAVTMFVAPGPAPGDDRRHATPLSTKRSLWWAAASFGFLAFSAGSLVAWVVASGVDAGLSEGAAGLALSVGAATGIAMRLALGLRVDRMAVRPLQAAAASAVVGAVGMAALAGRMSTAHVVATLLAFGSGWIWPVFTNFGVVRANGAAAGAASGITQTGVYVGVFLAPLTTGWLIERSGYPLMWMVVAAAAVVGAALALVVADDF